MRMLSSTQLEPGLMPTVSQFNTSFCKHTFELDIPLFTMEEVLPYSYNLSQKLDFVLE